MYSQNNRSWRTDLKKWETEYLFLGFIRFYRYSIFAYGKLKTNYTLVKRNKKTATYLNSANQLHEVVIGRQEFQERYNGNKYIIPHNIKYDERIS